MLVRMKHLVDLTEEQLELFFELRKDYMETCDVIAANELAYRLALTYKKNENGD